MNNTLTTETLIQFIYGEMDAAEAAQIRTAIQSDSSLRAAHQTLLSEIKLLDTEWFEPHPTSIKLIMEASSELQHHKIC